MGRATRRQSRKLNYTKRAGSKVRKPGCKLPRPIFCVRQNAQRAICYRKSVCLSTRPSVCPSHGWISRKRLNLGSCNFHRRVAHSSSFGGISFIQKFWRDPPPLSGGVKQWWVAAMRETSYFRNSNAFTRWLLKLDILSQLLQTYSPGGRTVVR